MKKTILFIAACLVTGLLYAQEETEVVRLSEPVMITETAEIFGSEMDLTKIEDAQSLSSVIASELSEDEVLIKTEVAQVCEKKGCFFVAQDGEFNARVSFIDYSFFVPTDAAGKEVVLRGVLSEKELTEEEAKHFAEDAGEDPHAISGAQKEYSIVATSVLVPKH